MLFLVVCAWIKEVNVIEKNVNTEKKESALRWVDPRLLIYIIKWAEENK